MVTKPTKIRAPISLFSIRLPVVFLSALVPQIREAAHGHLHWEVGMGLLVVLVLPKH